MKLYVLDKSSNEKTYLKQSASSKEELANLLGAKRFRLDDKIYSVNEVIAEADENTAGAMAAGGVIGVVGGVPGVIIGGLIGALLGNSSDNEDKLKTEKFNRSQV
ncbi:hypothetical protein B5G52_06160 [Pseudoalteromonas sp. A601]|uniref:hypothetical protein n=1 Tax=Pseudoalteromonas sp. A601 TaxID=1967839 RepID=UPI000B3D0ADB|nr:hypothetical protein [Pseudoalteromonas sp. A601]OUS72775.1 hypothetical protein B5G52_06160 [Pseudoalteromonas sp. A601]